MRKTFISAIFANKKENEYMKRLLSVMAVGAVLAACASTPQNQVVLKVASSQADCIGVAPQKCLLVQEVVDEKVAANGDWEFFYSNIEGFDYESGFEYTLLIDKVNREHVAADQSSVIYNLVKVVDKTAKTSDNLPKPLSLTKVR